MRIRCPGNVIITAENYLAPSEAGQNAVALDPAGVALLDRFADWTDPADVIHTFTEYRPEEVHQAIENLLACDLLCSPESVENEDLFLCNWSSWGEEARYFHFGTKDAEYLVGSDENQDMEFRRQVIEGAGPPPSLFKTYPDAPRLYLDRRFISLSCDFGNVLTSRRTHRTFTGDIVAARTFSTLLHYTFAPMMFCDADVFGPLPMKTSPSGGARHDLEGYVAVFAVEGIPPGLYHYNAEAHALELISETLIAR